MEGMPAPPRRAPRLSPGRAHGNRFGWGCETPSIGDYQNFYCSPLRSDAWWTQRVHYVECQVTLACKLVSYLHHPGQPVAEGGDGGHACPSDCALNGHHAEPHAEAKH